MVFCSISFCGLVRAKLSGFVFLLYTAQVTQSDVFHATFARFEMVVPKLNMCLTMTADKLCYLNSFVLLRNFLITLLSPAPNNLGSICF